MSFVPRDSVRSGLDHIEVRLGPLIASHLADRLDGRPWTSVLEQLDIARKRSPRTYNAGDVQSQLRMLTEHLGPLGYPFDKPGVRLVSTLGNYLRILRNAEKHNDPLTAMDAVRTHDCCARILDQFGDTEGAKVSAELLHEALGGVVAESRSASRAGDSDDLDPNSANLDRPPLAEHTPSPPPPESILVEPDALVLDRGSAEATPIIGSGRLTFDPWVPAIVGDESVIDNVARKANKARVRAVAQEAAEHEGPIHRDRLVDHVAAAFGVRRVTTRRAQQIAHQLKQIDLTMDADKFFWPSDVDPLTWTEFRPNSSLVPRDFLHVSPVEVANAMRFIDANESGLSVQELDAATLRTFGRQKRSRSAAAHLAVARVRLSNE